MSQHAHQWLWKWRRRGIDQSGDTRRDARNLQSEQFGYAACADFCGCLDDPGAGHDQPRWTDYSSASTTVDQQGIEAVLDRMDLASARLLHVGVGNSSLARRFARRLSHIVGITISPNEQRRAEQLGYRNYTALLLNKYSPQTRSVLPCEFRYIVDNNLASFACCKYHFFVMMDTYLSKLAIGGCIMTDKRGMAWSAGDPRWRLSESDLLGLGHTWPVTVEGLTNTVFAIRRS